MEKYAELPEDDFDDEEYLNIPHVKVRHEPLKFKDFSKKSNGWKTKKKCRKSWGGDARSSAKMMNDIE